MSTPLPAAARVRLTHAVAQNLADQHGVDLLHVKGPAVDPALRRQRPSSDADVLVRPAHLEIFLAALGRSQWREKSSFDEGSAFGHAANWFHPGLGYLDVHRRWPGPRMSDDAVFQHWWESRRTVQLANADCAVPTIENQRLILLLHAARDRGHRDTEVRRLWWTITPQARDLLWQEAAALGAEVALAAAVGELARFRDARDYHLWFAHSSDQTDRLDDWLGRWRAAKGPRARLSILLRSLVVNRAHLEFRLGRRPLRSEVFFEWWHRWGRLVRDLRQRGRPRTRTTHGREDR